MHTRWLDAKVVTARISRLGSTAAMVIPKIEFHELDPRWVNEQLTEEEIQDVKRRKKTTGRVLIS